MSKVELSKEYIAGFFDGEGCIVIGRRPPNRGRKTTSYCLQCSVVQATLEPLDYLQQKYGGIIVDRTKHKAPQNCYAWQIGSKKAEKFIEDIYPYIYLKKDEFDIAFQFCKTLTYGSKRVSEEVLNYKEFLKKELSECKKIKRSRRTIEGALV